AFKIGVRVDEFIQVIVRGNHLIDHKLARSQEAFVQVNGADDGLEGVSQYHLLEVRIFVVKLYDVCYADLARELIERLTVHNSRADLRQKPLRFERKFLEEVVSD